MIPAKEAKALALENKERLSEEHKKEYLDFVNTRIQKYVSIGECSCTIEISRRAPLDYLLPILKEYGYDVVVYDKDALLTIKWGE